VVIVWQDFVIEQFVIDKRFLMFYLNSMKIIFTSESLIYFKYAPKIMK